MNFTHEISIETYETEEGALCIFPPLKRIEANAKRLRAAEDEVHAATMKQWEEGGRKGDPPVVDRSQSEAYVKSHREARELAGDRIKVAIYPFRRFTKGDKDEAKRLSTESYLDSNGNEQFRLNQDKWDDYIVMASTGLTEGAIRELNPVEYQYLLEEILARTAVSPERLSFFAS